MTRRDFLATSLAAKSRGSQPNVVLIMPDQWRAMDLGVMGNEQIRTPVLDRLASESALLRNAVSNTPVCCPARATVLTGKYPHNCGVPVNDVPLPESERTLAEAFADAGYYTGFVGKWHLFGLPRMPGFVPPGAQRQGFQFWAANVCSHDYVNQQYFRDDPAPIPIRGYDTMGWTDLALEFLSRAKRQDRPFFLALWYPAPHNPYLVPPGYEGMYPAEKLPVRPNWRAVGRWNKKHLAGYYAAISCLDEQIGRLLGSLDEGGLRDDTIVVFTSDHGDMHGSQGTTGKRKPWEESVRVPCIVRWPARIRKGIDSDAPFSLLDLAPTLLGLAGVKGGAGVSGFDYSGYLLGRSRTTPEHAIMQMYTRTERNEFAPWRGLRSRRYKYARFADRPWLLYDLLKDPYELNNLVDSRAHRSLIASFDRELTEYMRSTNDSWRELIDAPRRGPA